ncbi:MAG: hypothetical protein AB1750_20825, partial [Chloroflexota bacterium]
ITKNNLLLIGVSTVGVRFATGLIGFLLTIIGLALGIAIGGGAYFATGDTTISIIAIAFGVLVFFFFIMLSSFITTYTNTAYHTCLYIWARDVEKAQERGRAGQVAAPAPLAAVLN